MTNLGEKSPREISREIGDRIRMMREARKVSQERLADKSGIHRSHMGEIERGKCNVTVETLRKIGVALDVSLAVLLKGVEHSSRK